MAETGDFIIRRPDKIDNLKAKKAAIEAQIARLNSAAAKEKRKLDTRRKILVGAVLLEEADRNPNFAKWLSQQLSRGLKQPRDRAIFNLPALAENSVVLAGEQSTGGEAGQAAD